MAATRYSRITARAALDSARLARALDTEDVLLIEECFTNLLAALAMINIRSDAMSKQVIERQITAIEIDLQS